MKPFEYFRISFESVALNKVRSFLTMLGVIIGVTAVILLVSLGEAAQKYIEQEFAGMGSNLIRITPGKQETSGMAPLIAGSFRKLTNDNAKEIRRKVPGIAGVAPMVMGAGAIRYHNLQRSSMVIGVTEDFEEVRGMHAQIGRSILRKDVDRNSPVCILGTTVKEELFGAKNALHAKVSINRRKFLVVGIMEEKGVTLGINMDDIVLIPLTASQQMFFGGQDEVFQILVAAQHPEEMDGVIEHIKEILIAAHDYAEDFTIIDQRSLLDTFGRIFRMLKIMLAGLASISLLVGGIGIMNIMLVSVRERTREVGIRKAVGARRRDIGFQFLVESVTLSSVGGILGVLCAFGGALILGAVYPVFPVSCSLWSVLMAFFFSLTVGVFFGVYPALKASSVDPVEALRYE